MLPPYRNADLHWYDDFREWLAEDFGEGSAAADSESPPPGFPGPEEAFNQLAKATPSGRVLARRMFVTALAARAFPEQMSNVESDLSRAAIAALGGPKPDDFDLRPRELYEILNGQEPIGIAEKAGPRELWSGIVKAAVAKETIPDEIGMFPPPCSARLVTVPGITGPVPALVTDEPVEKIAFDEAARFIVPENWHTCRPDFWCVMDQIPGRKVSPGQRVYREVVSTHCKDKGGVGFWAETELLFTFMWVPDKKRAKAAIANYELADPRPDRRAPILVDEGTILVAKTGERGKLRVTTTKRIKFSHPFMFEAIPVIMCAFGYADVAGSLLACAAKYGKDLEATGPTPPQPEKFPGVAASVAAQSANGPGSAYTAGPARGYGQTTVGGLLQDTANIWARALRESAAAFERSTGTASRAKPGKKPNGSGG